MERDPSVLSIIWKRYKTLFYVGILAAEISLLTTLIQFQDHGQTFWQEVLFQLGITFLASTVLLLFFEAGRDFLLLSRTWPQRLEAKRTFRHRMWMTVNSLERIFQAEPTHKQQQLEFPIPPDRVEQMRTNIKHSIHTVNWEAARKSISRLVHEHAKSMQRIKPLLEDEDVGLTTIVEERLDMIGEVIGGLLLMGAQNDALELQAEIRVNNFLNALLQ